MDNGLICSKWGTGNILSFHRGALQNIIEKHYRSEYELYKDLTSMLFLFQVNLGLRCNLPNPKVMYPLCYRHDLCFWVKEAESEDVLLAAIRHCCGDIVHSVKLLRILRHEESGLLSFCYRMIYSRCDGPLSQKESVELQNKLRLCLIDLNFDLR